MVYNCNHLSLFAWLLIVKADCLLLLWLCDYYSPNTTASWLVNRKVVEFYITKARDLTGKPAITFEIQMCIRIILEFFEKYTCPGIDILLQSSRCLSNEQPCLKTTELYDYLLLFSSLFHFFYFIFNALISFSLYFPISPSLLFHVLSQEFIKHTRKVFVHTHI